MCVRYPVLRNFSVGIPVAFASYLLMLVPVIYTSITDVNVYSLPTGRCPDFWSDFYLLAYGSIFFLVFTWFAWDLRHVADSYVDLFSCVRACVRFKFTHFLWLKNIFHHVLLSCVGDSCAFSSSTSSRTRALVFDLNARFHLATEFRAIGFTSLIMMIIWYLFNNVNDLIEIDVHVFRFSVAVLFMAHVVAFTCGIVRVRSVQLAPFFPCGVA